MTTLNSGFEDDLREALLDDVERELVGKQDNLVFQFVDRAHEVLEEYGQRHDYDVEPVIESLGQPEVDRGEGYITVRIGWSHEAAPYFQMGTSDHEIQGNPVLSFIWESPPTWVRHEFDREGDGFRVFLPEVDVSGLPESRFVRSALDWLRREVAR
jgi:hypothetical protein